MNILIVESKNDKAFVEAVIRNIQTDLNATDTTIVDEPICKIDEYDCLDGLSEKALNRKLQDIISELTKKPVEKIGILIDLDDKTAAQRIDLVNKVIQDAFKETKGIESIAPINAINEFIIIQIDNDTTVEIACHFTNYKGKGELETLLKGIKTKPSPSADCLDEWRNCLAAAAVKISQKDFDKFWINNYIRFDTCSAKDSGQAGRKCSTANLEYIFEHKTSIFDFLSPELDEMKIFLRLFT